jgi:F-type H+-transporting ATPase subunit gamma
METLEAIAGRMETADSIRDIVRVMKSLSMVSIEQFERAVDALHDHRRAIDLGLTAVLREGPPEPALAAAAPGRAVIVVGSDRGLCGRFNETVADFARGEALAPGPHGAPKLLAVGRRGADRLARVHGPPDAALELPGAAEGLTRAAEAILVQLDAWQREAGVGDIRVVFNRRRPHEGTSPKIERLAPVSPRRLARLAAARWPARGLPMHSMPRAALLSELLRQDLFLGVYRALARSLAAEHAARLEAMQGAERNIEERREDLTAAYRKKRQETITSELLDIVSGFEAAQGDPR